MTVAPLTIRLFGPLQILVQGEPMVRVRTRSVEWLLALLVLRSGRQVNRSWLAGTLWPDSEETQSLQNLRNGLLSLRKALGSEAWRISSPTRDALAIDLEGAAVDLLQFDQAIQAGDDAALAKAVELHGGPLLEGCLEEWAFLEREARQQACLHALEALSDSAERRAGHPEALVLLRRAEGMDSLKNSIQRGLMRNLSAAGDAPAALFVYREHRARLRREMNVEPDPETTALYQQIRKQSSSPAFGRSSPTLPMPVIEEPAAEHMHEPSTAPPRPSSLPHPITKLIGRDQAVREVAGLIANSRLVTLVGGGGVGKTRLSIQAAQEAASGFADGVVFAALAQLSDPSLLAGFVAAAVGLREEADHEPEIMLDVLANWLTGHSILLVLDNCEHLVAAAAQLARSLLERCPSLHILATSRQRLGLIGEIAWRVPSLPFPEEELLSDSAHAADSILAYPAVQLFIERAEMARPGLRISKREQALDVAHICRRLDGIPLAIELAAARVEMLTVAQIAERLADRFSLLTGTGHGVLPRHQTLHTLIDWSYDLLTDAEREMLRRLSVFAGGWSLDAAEFISQPDSDVLGLVGSLVNKSLVLVDDTPSGVRYRMLATVREYAHDKLLASGKEEAVQRHHLSWCLKIAADTQVDLRGAKQEAALESLDREESNLRAALQFGREIVPEQHLQLASVLWPFWHLRGHYSEGREQLLVGLNHAVDASPAIRARALLGLATLANAQWDVRATNEAAQKSLDLCRSIGDAQGVADALLCIGSAAFNNSAYPEARNYYSEAIETSRRIGYRQGLVAALSRLGFLFIGINEFDAARQALTECLAVSQSLGVESYTAEALHNLGRLARCEGDLDGAMDFLRQSLEISERLGHIDSVSAVLVETAMVAALQGDLARTRQRLDEHIEIWRRLGNPVRVAWGLLMIGHIAYRQKEYATAREWYEESQVIFREHRSRIAIACACNSLGSVAFHESEVQASRELHNEALRIYSDLGLLDGTVWSLERLGVLHAHLGNPELAVKLCGAASTAREELGVPLGPWDQEDLNRARESMRHMLGKRFSSEWESCRELSLDQAVSCAIDEG